MTVEEIEPGETEELLPETVPDDQHHLFVYRTNVLVAHNRQRAWSTGDDVQPGDRVKLEDYRGESVFIHNPESNDETARVRISETNFALTYMNRYVQGFVQSGSGAEAAPANDQEVTFADTKDLDQDTVTLQMDGVDAAERLSIQAEFDAAGHVEVHFMDGEGNRHTSRLPADNPDYEVGGAGKVYVTPEVVYPSIEVDLVDDSADGTSNSTDFNVYYR